MSDAPRLSRFSSLSQYIAFNMGRSGAFVFALLIVLAWIITGPLFHFNELWQWLITTATSIVTFLMVFLIQNTQNREMTALHLKMDELIRSTHGAHNVLLDLEKHDTELLEEMRQRYQDIAARARRKRKKGQSDVHVEAMPSVPQFDKK